MMSYINETDFVIENKELVYPEIITDGLQLYYDAKGKRDTDYHRDTMLDMSGNKNHGELQNFAYAKHSGYKDGLVFDYIDDKLVRPTLNLKPDDFTFMLNGNIISFSPDGTVKRVQDGEVIERKGFNLIENGGFWNGTNGWTQFQANISVTNNGNLKVENNGGQAYAQVWRYVNLAAKSKYYFRAKFELGNKDTNPYVTDWFNWGVKSSEGLYELVKENISEETNRVQLKFSDSSTLGDYYYINNIQLINLTAAFGAGNEPTLKEIQAEPDKWQWLPNPLDVVEAKELKGNILGDIENIVDGLYKTEVLSGEEVYTDKADDAVVHVDVDGKSYQHAGSGKNLFNLEKLKSLSPKSWATIARVYDFNLKENTKYTLSTNLPQGQNELYLNGSESNDRDVYLGKSLTIETDSSGEIYIAVASDRARSNAILNGEYWIQLEEGSTATEYEPPAPTPDYPIEIHSLNDFDVVSSVGRENLIRALNSNNYSGIREVNEEGVVIRGRIGAGDTLQTLYKARTSGGSHTFSYETKEGSSHRVLIRIYNENGEEIEKKSISGWTWNGNYKGYHREVNNNGYAVFNAPSETRYITGVVVPPWHPVVDVTLLWMKLEKGNKPTAWTPAPEDITENDNHPLIDKINLLLGEPLRSVGDVKDRIFRDSDGLWKIERNIEENIYNGSEREFWNFQTSGSAYSRWALTNDTDKNNFNRETILSSHFQMMEGQLHTPWHGFESRGVIYFYLPMDSDLLTSPTWRAWLSENPVTVLRKLVEPNVEILSQYLQDRLNNLRSFSENNYIYTVKGDANLLDTVPLLQNHRYAYTGVLNIPVPYTGHTATQEPIPVYPGAKIKLTKINAGDNYWRIVWVDKDNNVVRRETPTDNDLILTVPNRTYGMRVSYVSAAEPVIRFDKSNTLPSLSDNFKPTLHTKFLYNNWYKEDRVINNLMIYNRALTNEEMLQNYKTIKRRWGM